MYRGREWRGGGGRGSRVGVRPRWRLAVRIWAPRGCLSSRGGRWPRPPSRHVARRAWREIAAVLRRRSCQRSYVSTLSLFHKGGSAAKGNCLRGIGDSADMLPNGHRRFRAGLHRGCCGDRGVRHSRGRAPAIDVLPVPTCIPPLDRTTGFHLWIGAPADRSIRNIAARLVIGSIPIGLRSFAEVIRDRRGTRISQLRKPAALRRPTTQNVPTTCGTMRSRVVARNAAQQAAQGAIARPGAWNQSGGAVA